MYLFHLFRRPTPNIYKRMLLDNSFTVTWVNGVEVVGIAVGAPAHNLLSATHPDTLADTVVDGDIIIGNGTPKWSRLARQVPAINVRNVLGIDNGETRPSWKSVLDATNPTTIGVGDTAGPGTSLVFSHRDHQHASPATWVPSAHDLLSSSHSDTLADSVVDGDIIIGNVTPKWSRLARSVPSANIRNVLGIDNGETRPSWKTALDSTNPTTIGIGDSAAPGTSLVFSHRDHQHASPSTWTPSGHDLLSAYHSDTLADTVVDGDILIGNVTPKWSRLARSIPSTNVRNVLGIDNGELRSSWKAALDSTNPATIGIGDSANPGTSLVFSHRDHQHASPATWTPSAHTHPGTELTGFTNEKLVVGTVGGGLGSMANVSYNGTTMSIKAPVDSPVLDLTNSDLSVNGQYNYMSIGQNLSTSNFHILYLHNTDPDNRTLNIGTSEGWNTGEVIILKGDGKVGIGVSPTTYKFEVAGTSYFSDHMTFANTKGLKDGYLVTPIPVSQSGTTALAGFTATSIIGCLNELKGNVTGFTDGKLVVGNAAGSLESIPETDWDGWNLDIDGQVNTWGLASYEDGNTIIELYNKYLGISVDTYSMLNLSVDGLGQAIFTINNLNKDIDFCVNWDSGITISSSGLTGNVGIGAAPDTYKFKVTGTSYFSDDMTFANTKGLKDGYLVTPIPVSQSGTTALVGFTATSIVGCLNELKAGYVNYWARGTGVLYPATITDTLQLGDSTHTSSLKIWSPDDTFFEVQHNTDHSEGWRFKYDYTSTGLSIVSFSDATEWEAINLDPSTGISAISASWYFKITDFTTAGYVKNNASGIFSSSTTVPNTDLSGFTEDKLAVGSATGYLESKTNLSYNDTTLSIKAPVDNCILDLTNSDMNTNGQYNYISIGQNISTSNFHFLYLHNTVAASRALYIGTSEAWNSGESIVLMGDGKVGVGAAPSTYKFEVSGDAFYSRRLIGTVYDLGSPGDTVPTWNISTNGSFAKISTLGSTVGIGVIFDGFVPGTIAYLKIYQSGNKVAALGKPDGTTLYNLTDNEYISGSGASTLDGLPLDGGAIALVTIWCIVTNEIIFSYEVYGAAK